MIDKPAVLYSEVAHLIDTPAPTPGENPNFWESTCPGCGAPGSILRNDGIVKITCVTETCDDAQKATDLGLTVDELHTLRDDVVLTPGHSFSDEPIDWSEVVAPEDLDRARLVLRHIRDTGKDVAHTSEAGWLLWEGAHWTRLDDGDIRRFVHEVADNIYDAASSVLSNARALRTDGRKRDTPTTTAEADAREAQARALDRTSRAFRSTKHTDNILRELPALPGVRRSLTDFDQNKDVIGVGNGVVELRTGELREYRKEDLIIRRIAVDYDPDAVNPRWERFVSEIFVDEAGALDPELPEYIQRLIGYGITGHVTEQILPVFFGGGSNGKGVLIETLQHVFRAHTVTTAFSTFEARPSGGIPNDIAALAGARLVMASEGEQGAPMAEAVIKRIVGGDTISARFMRKEFFEFAPSFLILLATNYKPNFRGQDFGLWRRVKLIPFRRTFSTEERDDKLGAKFQGAPVPAINWRDGDDLGNGLSGILAWAVRGAVKWYADGLGEPDSIKTETAKFRNEQDRIGEFLTTYFDVTGKRSDKVTLAAAWTAHHEWAEESRETAVKVRQTFSNMLSERQGITREVRPNGAVIFRGLKLLTPIERKAREEAERRAEAREDRPLTALPEPLEPFDGAAEVS